MTGDIVFWGKFSTSDVTDMKAHSDCMQFYWET